MSKVSTMPLKISLSEELEDIPFKVLNSDNLPLIIKGDSIFKPFGTENQKYKPNLVVYPTRRTNLEESAKKDFSKSNGYINNIENKKQLDFQKRKLSNSNGHLNHTNSSIRLRVEDLKNEIDAKFTRALDSKLRRLQKDEKKTQNIEIKKPLFVTTVKVGEFLDPPQDVSTSKKVDEIDGRKFVYTHTSLPRVNKSPPRDIRKTQTEAAAVAASRVARSVVGLPPIDNSSSETINKDVPMPYANLMHDRRVVRGSNFSNQPGRGHQGDGESAAARAAEARRRAIARKKAKNQQVRAAQLRLGSPPPVVGRHHEPVQTDLYLEEIFTNPPVVDMCTQTDLFLERPVSPFYVPAKTGQDAETQIHSGDLFDFDMEVQPILEVLVGKTIEQALIEVLEEEELAAIREQQRRFMELRAAETCEAQRIQEREKRLMLEKARRMKEHEQALEMQRQMEERIAASILMQGYMADLLPEVLEGLENEGFLVDYLKQDVDETFMPWLMKEVASELHDVITSRDILTDIVKEILENRAEIYNALNSDLGITMDDREEEEEAIDMVVPLAKPDEEPLDYYDDDED